MFKSSAQDEGLVNVVYVVPAWEFKQAEFHPTYCAGTKISRLHQIGITHVWDKGVELHRKNLKTQQSSVIFEQGNHIIIVTSIFSIPTLKRNLKPAFSNFFGLKSVFEKLRFREGLVWVVSLTVEMKLRFHIPPAYYGQALSIWLAFSFDRPK